MSWFVFLRSVFSIFRLVCLVREMVGFVMVVVMLVISGILDEDLVRMMI